MTEAGIERLAGWRAQPSVAAGFRPLPAAEVRRLLDALAARRRLRQGG